MPGPDSLASACLDMLVFFGGLLGHWVHLETALIAAPRLRAGLSCMVHLPAFLWQRWLLQPSTALAGLPWALKPCRIFAFLGSCSRCDMVC